MTATIRNRNKTPHDAKYLKRMERRQRLYNQHQAKREHLAAKERVTFVPTGCAVYAPPTPPLQDNATRLPLGPTAPGTSFVVVIRREVDGVEQVEYEAMQPKAPRPKLTAIPTADTHHPAE